MKNLCKIVYRWSEFAQCEEHLFIRHHANDADRSIRGLRLLAALLTIHIIATGADAADWPQWGRTNNRNMVSDEKGLPDSFSTGIGKNGEGDKDATTARHIKWVARLGSQSFGNPVVAEGKVFVGSNGSPLLDGRDASDRAVLLCLDETTGRLLWQLSVPRDPANRNLARGHKNGLCCSPTIEDGRAWFCGYRCDVLCVTLNGFTGNNTGPFQDEARYLATPGQPPVKLQATDGDIVWRYDLENQLHASVHDACASAPLIAGNRLYVASGNGVNQNHKQSDMPDAPGLIVLDKNTGELVAQDDEKIGMRIFHGSWSSPSLAIIKGKPQLLFGAGDGYCYAFDPEPVREQGQKVGLLKKIWSFDANGGNRAAYGRKQDSPSEVLGTPVAWQDRVYVTVGQDWTHGPGKGRLSCIDATRTGDISQTGVVWICDQIGRSVATPTISDGLVYVTDILGKAYCLDAMTGNIQWTFDAGAPIWHSILVADGKAYFGNSKGRFFILATGREKKALWEADLRSPMCGAPIVANGVLYVATYTHLYAIQN